MNKIFAIIILMKKYKFVYSLSFINSMWSVHAKDQLKRQIVNIHLEPTNGIWSEDLILRTIP